MGKNRERETETDRKRGREKEDKQQTRGAMVIFLGKYTSELPCDAARIMES